MPGGSSPGVRAGGRLFETGAGTLTWLAAVGDTVISLASQVVWLGAALRWSRAVSVCIDQFISFLVT